MNAETLAKHEEKITAGGRGYACEFRRRRQGGYLVTCRKFLPLLAYGDTLEEARAKAEAWLEYADCREFD